jgi:Family of unknown function (DUF5856)
MVLRVGVKGRVISRMSADHIHFFLAMRTQIKLYHWQTYSYARHKATDEVVGLLDGLTDTFVETYAGKYGRSTLKGKYASFTLKNLTDKAAVAFVKECIGYLQGAITKSLDGKKDTDLLNLRDEILGELNKLLYLFSLH